MNAIISNDDISVNNLKLILEKVPSMQGLELSSKVSTKESYFFGDKNSNFNVAVLDLGIKTNILRCGSGSKDLCLKSMASEPGSSTKRGPLDRIATKKTLLSQAAVTEGASEPRSGNKKIAAEPPSPS